MLEEFYGKGDVSLDTASSGTFTTLAADANLGLLLDPIGADPLAARWAGEELPQQLRVRLPGLAASGVCEFLCTTLRETSQQIWHRGQRERLLDGVGACVAVAHVRGGSEFFVAWVGDCRAYFRQAGEIRCLTQDDYDAQIFTARPLTQYLGTGDLAPHSLSGHMGSGDSLLLCTQGLPESELQKLWRDSAFVATQRLAGKSRGLLVMQPYGTS